MVYWRVTKIVISAPAGGLHISNIAPAGQKREVTKVKNNKVVMAAILILAVAVAVVAVLATSNQTLAIKNSVLRTENVGLKSELADANARADATVKTVADTERLIGYSVSSTGTDSVASGLLRQFIDAGATMGSTDSADIVILFVVPANKRGYVLIKDRYDNTLMDEYVMPEADFEDAVEGAINTLHQQKLNKEAKKTKET
ncbi:MAG: hypothetical protein Q7S37_01165 [bacterium]|nr:hypothetical protein [bacterium]